MSGRTDATLAGLLFGAEPAPTPEAKPPEPTQPRSMEELASTIFAPRSEQDTEPGREALRTVDGLLLESGESRLELAASNNSRLTRADLSGLDFGDRSLPNSRMSGADLRGATMHGSLTGSDLRGADLRGADLSGANLLGANLEGALFDGTTRIAGASFAGCKVDLEAVRQCSGWRLAKNLRP